MMRSLYSGVSGLQNHQVRMDVIGNNISNVNTTGFKKGRVNFQDLLSQNMRGAARPTDELGGVNPQQVGLGANIAAIDTIHSQGSLQTTGNKTDVAIQGDGMFVMRSGDQNFFTRNGVFSLDADGVLVNPANGMRVQGWQAELVDGETMINTSESIGDLQIPVGGKDPARATTLVEIASNLNKNTPVIGEDATNREIQEGTWSTSYDIYDSFGNNHELRVSYTRDPDTPNQWIGTVEVNPNEEGIIPEISIGGIAAGEGTNTFTVQFDNAGTLESISHGAGGLIDEGELTLDIAFQVPETAIPDVIDPETVDPSFVGEPGEQITQTLTVQLGRVGAFENSTTQYSSASSNKVFRQNGYAMGYLEDFRIDQSGQITGVYSNGTNRALGQIALASFVNPGGLEKVGETNFRTTINSGDPDVGPAGTMGKGQFIAGALEMSNVDLSEEFTDMIVTQRGFQANSKTIQTTDQMLQEVLTLKR
ncbi:flagellar hook protein FlgE [Spirochaeta africana]|nr:flagellar hook protein FlgE [Spirochaeta africana]